MEVFPMCRLATLVLALALGSAAAPASADDAIPDVSFPSLPVRGQATADLVPTGWSVEKEARGDLSGDGLPDVVLLLRMTDPANAIPIEGLGADRLDTNPRMLVVAFVNAETHALSLVLADHTLIPRHSDPRMEDPFHDVSLVRGTLRVSLGTWMSAGGWSTSNAKLTFRHQDGCFRLIGYDATEYQRNSGKLSKLSVNYLTRKVQRSWGYEDDAMNETWRSFETPDLLCLEAVGDGLEFHPKLESDPDRAAELLEAAAATEPRWSIDIASLPIGSDDRTATLADVRATCSAEQLRRALDPTAGELHDCLAGMPTVRITVAFAGGRIASRVEPDNEATSCVSLALDRAHFDDQTCTFEASLPPSRPQPQH
jgi:hypothetical protein